MSNAPRGFWKMPTNPSDMETLLVRASERESAVLQKLKDVTAQRDELRTALKALLRESRRWVRRDRLKLYNIQIDVTNAEAAIAEAKQ